MFVTSKVKIENDRLGYEINIFSDRSALTKEMEEEDFDKKMD